MTISPRPTDYYAVLGVHPAASDAEITRAWRRLVLISHPDKRDHAGGGGGDSASASPSPSNTPPPSRGPRGSSGTSDGTAPDIRLVNEARAVLSDPARRAEFDIARAARPPPAAGPRIREFVSLEAFAAHPSEDEPERYTLPCRCGQEYAVTVDELEEGVDVVGCPGCGEYIGVEYDVLEDADDGGPSV